MRERSPPDYISSEPFLQGSELMQADMLNTTV